MVQHVGTSLRGRGAAAASGTPLHTRLRPELESLRTHPHLQPVARHPPELLSQEEGFPPSPTSQFTKPRRPLSHPTVALRRAVMVQAVVRALGPRAHDCNLTRPLCAGRPLCWPLQLCRTARPPLSYPLPPWPQSFLGTQPVLDQHSPGRVTSPE